MARIHAIRSFVGGSTVLLRNMSSKELCTTITSDAGVEARQSLPDRAGAEGSATGLGPDFASARVAVEGLGSGVEAWEAWTDLAGEQRRSVEGWGPGPSSATGAVECLASGVDARHAFETDLALDCRDALHDRRAVRAACADSD